MSHCSYFILDGGKDKMKDNHLENDETDNIKKLDLQIERGNEFIENLKITCSFEKMESLFNFWRKNTKEIFNEIFKDDKNSRLFEAKTHANINKLSISNTKDILAESVNRGIDFIESLKIGIKTNKFNALNNNFLDKDSALIVIRRILQNFYKHIQVMYQEEIHGNGTIKKEALDAIQIGNEYDVQRILYSLIRPIFPTSRLEVSDDGGYKGIRYDVKIDEYNMVIEVKCTRKSMTEKNLTEELGADAFHYKADYIFFFIYDKENIIKNKDAFTKNYKRKKTDFGTDIEAIINQPITI